MCLIVYVFCEGDFCVQFDGSSLNEANEFRELLYDAMCGDVGTGGGSLLVVEHGPLDTDRATEHGPCAVNHKTEKSR